MLALMRAAMESDERLAEMRRILTEELSDDNYFIVKYVVHFLTEVFLYCTQFTIRDARGPVVSKSVDCRTSVNFCSLYFGRLLTAAS